MDQIGDSLRKAYTAAVAARNLQVEAHRGFTAGLPAELVKEWEDQCDVWDKAPFPKSKHAAINPYAIPDTCKFSNSSFIQGLIPSIDLSESEVQQELALEEQQRIGGGGLVLHTTSPAKFLALGLELEEAQCVYLWFLLSSLLTICF